MYSTTGMNKIGIFGGTFDPVHKGHIHAAKCFREECGLDLVYVIPNYISNLKNHRSVSSEHRLAMLELAFGAEEGFVVSDIEIARGGVSYTADTVRTLQELHPESQLYLFFGDDWLEGFPRWHDFEYLRSHLIVALANRSGRDISALTEQLRNEYGVQIVPLQFTAIPASSTAFRGGDSSLCTEEVNRYIAEKGLYR